MFSGVSYGKLNDSWEHLSDGLAATVGSNHDIGSVVFCVFNFLFSFCFVFFHIERRV